MNRTQKISFFSEKLKSSNGILEYELKVYSDKTQKKILKLVENQTLDIDKLAELILIRKKEIDPNV